ncbi:MAG: HAD family hydrolase [Actinomycetes bacterium]
MPDPVDAPSLRGLVVDWGGVLTHALGYAMTAWAVADGVDGEQFRALMREWLAPAAGAQAHDNPVHALERGEIEVPDFERRLAERLETTSGVPVDPEGLLGRMFERFEHAPNMVGLVRRAHASGIRTALLSNSWGTDDYPRDGWDQMFDVVVISGEVGMRKPEPEIFAHTVELLGLAAPECVFVDDLRHNVDAAVALGFVGIRHTSYETTAAELEVLFERRLSA